ncbi:transcription elongation factor GreAB [Mycobacterium intermedium]|uniref:Transcription elongation factor GreAB n=1 Tax=Mycobacterium intermedium TaxID=28445 RepID=A0A1E3SK05_MYCIE|nr:GreA/GreB family elongation factor [Mycobacterium intermedium]MCV6965586.1 GreA/GreB family elongation factor [Mycobacterium intermedium]ODR02449.1 transcription elongation factor GreAB [Mycobacterium intermedium]OPE51613.1 transcription elongation factor GreAB [Mycobacterium intermedium]ORA96798.1 transcription elongation factor GreAB [Mycobacterium intermedium]
MKNDAQTVWLSQQAYQNLQQELATLRALNAVAPQADDDDNSVLVRKARHARIQQIHDLLTDAVIGEDPPDDGIAEAGMVVTVRYDDGNDAGHSGGTETFLLGVRGAEHGDLEVYSVKSPLGAAILGARPGERRTYTLPNGGVCGVTIVECMPYGLHRAALT